MCLNESLRICFKKLIKVHNYITIIQFVLIIISFLIFLSGILEKASDKVNIILLISIVVIVLLNRITSDLFFKQRLNSIKKVKILNNKSKSYEISIIIKYIISIISFTLAIFFFFLTSNISFLGIALIVVLLFYINKPSRDKFVIELELTSTEKEMFECNCS